MVRTGIRFVDGKQTQKKMSTQNQQRKVAA